MRARVPAGLLVVMLMLAPAVLFAGEFGIPCDPGSSSANGFEPCTLCAPGTFTSFTGADHCDACPAGSFATVAGAATCVPCQCSDGVACTIDSCDAATATCSAEPVASCEPLTMHFEGTVTEIGLTSSQSSAVFSLGMPITGYFVLDPLAPDADPLSETFGSFPGGVLDFSVRVGEGATAFDTTASEGQWLIVNDNGENGDTYQIRIVDFAGAPIPGATRDQFVLYLRDKVPATAITSDAASAEIPDPAAFPFAELQFVLDEDLAIRSVAHSTDFTLSAPEPNVSDLAVAAAATLFALARRQRRAREDEARGDAGQAVGRSTHRERRSPRWRDALPPPGCG